MSQTDAAFQFLSWLRRGGATQLATPDAATASARATLPIALAFGTDEQASVSLELLGAGDVTGFDARGVVRVWPPAGTSGAEPNYFPLVELDQPDLPWRYTPTAPDASGRLRPWLALITLADSEITSFVAPSSGRPLGSVTIASGTPMPAPDQTWAWSHAQISGDDGMAIADVIATAPERCVARLLSPRRLDPDTHYTAMLVPAFEVGRLAGLRQPTATVTTLAPAWASTNGALTAALELPVYYQWSFSTGADGDFASLVRQLVARPLPPSVGTRSIDASNAGGGLPAAASAPLALGGALRSPSTVAGPTLDPAFVTALTAVLNLPATAQASGGDPIVGPPLYGTWQAQRATLDPSQPPPWFATLNGDPQWRIAAALGAAVVQGEQQALMASAWAQVAGIRETNDRLRKAQLARAVGERLHARFVQPVAIDDAVVQLAAPVHGHVLTATQTVATLVATSPQHTALVSPAFRRLRRPLGPLGRRQRRADAPAAPVLAKVNTGAYASVLPAVPTESTQLPTYDWLTKQVPAFRMATAVDIAKLPAQPVEVATDPVLAVATTAVATTATTTLATSRSPMLAPTTASRSATSTVSTTSTASTTSTSVATVKAVDSASMALFRSAVAAFANRAVAPGPGETLHQLDLPTLRTTLSTAIDPAIAIPAGLRARIAALVAFPWSPPDPIAPVMAYPQFPQPMYAPLAALSPDWLLPGLPDVPANTVALAATNPAFIEAYLVGLNHEMARELLWNDYPTDQRGSYFRQFWDPAGLVAAPIPDTAMDITRINTWPSTSDLGTHSPRPVPPDGAGAFLVLVVRGEVLRRYPGTIVYAQQAQLAGTTYSLGATQLDPAFGGRLAPDVAFYGFALAETDARGAGTTASPGWFFVFQEQPSEPKFGLEPGAGDGSDIGSTPASWDALAWPQLVAAGQSLSSLHYIDLAAAQPVTAALEVAGGPGWHVTAAAAGKPFARGADQATIAYRRPVRVALHAAQMLP